MKQKTRPETMQPKDDANYSIQNLKGRVKQPVEPVSEQKMREAVVTGATKGLKSSGQSPRK